MSSHVWDRKPTRAKANRLAEALQYCAEQDLTGPLAVAFAGYYCERTAQTSRVFLQELFTGAIRSGFRFAEREEYSRLVPAHMEFWTDGEVDWRPNEVIPEDYY